MTFAQTMKYMREQQRREQNWSAKQAKAQMDFQKSMSDTAHQREISDLKAAGLNPVLTASGGSGASAPSGAMADMQSIAGMIPQALSVASDAVKAVKHSAKAVKNENSSTTVNVNPENNNNPDLSHAPLLPLDGSNNSAKDTLQNFIPNTWNVVHNGTIGDIEVWNNVKVRDAMDVADAIYADAMANKDLAEGAVDFANGVRQWSEDYQKFMENMPARRRAKTSEQMARRLRPYLDDVQNARDLISKYKR